MLFTHIRLIGKQIDEPEYYAKVVKNAEGRK